MKRIDKNHELLAEPPKSPNRVEFGADGAVEFYGRGEVAGLESAEFVWLDWDAEFGGRVTRTVQPIRADEEMSFHEAAEYALREFKRDAQVDGIVCTFCGKTRMEVRKIIAGPRVYICDECVTLCWDILQEEAEA